MQYASLLFPFAFSDPKEDKGVKRIRKENGSTQKVAKNSNDPLANDVNSVHCIKRKWVHACTSVGILAKIVPKT